MSAKPQGKADSCLLSCHPRRLIKLVAKRRMEAQASTRTSDAANQPSGEEGNQVSIKLALEHLGKAKEHQKLVKEELAQFMDFAERIHEELHTIDEWTNQEITLVWHTSSCDQLASGR